MSTLSPLSLVRKFARRNSAKKTIEIAVGSRFEQADVQPSVWVVERISNVNASVYPLVSLSREGRPDLKKIVSLAVLSDGEGFRPVAGVTVSAAL